MNYRVVRASDLQCGDRICLEGIGGMENMGAIEMLDLHPSGAVAAYTGSAVIAFEKDEAVTVLADSLG